MAPDSPARKRIDKDTSKLPRELDMADDARVAHLERRVAALTRQLEIRIGEVAAARDERDQLRRQLDAAMAKADDYERLMATATMRLLRVPRDFYGRLRDRTEGRRR